MSKPPEISNGEPGKSEDTDRVIISNFIHPQLGRVIEFTDDIGLGMQIGEGEDSFIVRSEGPGIISSEAHTENARRIVLKLIGKVIDRRGGHN